VEEPVSKMLPVEETSPEKAYETSLERNMDLPQDAGLWPSVITGEFMTKCIVRERDYVRSRDPGKYYLSTRHCPERTRYLSNSVFERKLTNGEKILDQGLLFLQTTGRVYCFAYKFFYHCVVLHRT
jgi:hypothetical protein